MVYAPRGIGKTFFALNVAYAVATGGEFLGWKAERPRSVLYLDGEMVASEMQNRLRRISKHDKEECELRLLTPDFQEYGMPNLSESSGQRAIEGHVNLADLIIVDNIASLCRGGSENETEAWQPVQQWALALRAMGKSVLFVHHSGKSGKQRGTSSREDVLDTVVELKLPSDYVSDEGARFEVHFNKHRSFYGNEAKPFEARLTSNKEGEHEEWLVSPLAKGNYEQVVELFNTGVSQADISKRLNLDKSTVSRHVKRARAEGEITSKGE
jgi:RecA-family ATPase